MRAGGIRGLMVDGGGGGGGEGGVKRNVNIIDVIVYSH